MLHICQGFSSSWFYWDDSGQCFRVKSGNYVSHLTQTSLRGILDRFIYAATCLQLVDIIVNKNEKPAVSPPPTLRAFTCSVSAWLRVCTFPNVLLLCSLFISDFLFLDLGLLILCILFLDAEITRSCSERGGKDK